MKATGLVRRIDDLGRVVIPKEIRRTMKIREGDPLELFTGRDGEVIFKKYTPCTERECEAIFKGLYSSVCAITSGKVAVYGTDDVVIRRNSQNFPTTATDRADECEEFQDYKVYVLKGLEDPLGYLVVENDNDTISTLVNHTKTLLRELDY